MPYTYDVTIAAHFRWEIPKNFTVRIVDDTSLSREEQYAKAVPIVQSEYATQLDGCTGYSLLESQYYGTAPGDVVEFIANNKNMCYNAQEWLIKQPGMKAAWDSCTRADWLLWGITHAKMASRETLLNLLIRWVEEYPLGEVIRDLFSETAEEYAHTVITMIKTGKYDSDLIERLQLNWDDWDYDSSAYADTSFLNTLTQMAVHGDVENYFWEIAVDVRVLWDDWEIGDSEEMDKWLCDDIRKVILNPWAASE